MSVWGEVEVEHAQRLLKERKRYGWSWYMISNRLSWFTQGKRSYAACRSKLRRLAGELK